MSDHPIYNVLFLCTGNSARSVLAECILNRTGMGRFRAFSAGSQPTGAVNLHTLELLERLNYSIEGLRSKSWDEFSGENAPTMDFVITVCDSAAGEVCPIWPGQPMNAHWGFADPAAVQGSDAEKRVAFATAYKEINTRIEIFVNLPLQSLDRLSLQRRLDEIGRTPADSA